MTDDSLRSWAGEEMAVFHPTGAADWVEAGEFIRIDKEHVVEVQR